MNTNNIDYLAIDELVRRAHRERSAALGSLVGDGLQAGSIAARKIAQRITREIAAAMQPPARGKSLPHCY